MGTGSYSPMPSLRLYSPSGALLSASSCCSYYKAEITGTLPVSGSYTLVAADAYGSGTGAYNVSLQCLSADCNAPVYTRFLFLPAVLRSYSGN